jgi:hypothetical protein
MRIARTGFALLAVAFCLAGARSAEASSRSWDVARGVLPGDLQAVAGANVSVIQKTALYQQLLPLFMAKNPDLKRHMEGARSACGVDLVGSVVDLTAAVRSDEKGLIVVALRGVDQARVLSCFQALSARDKTGKVTAKTTGSVTAYSHAGSKDVLYLAWLARDVVAVASDPHDGALLRALIGGKGATGDVATTTARVSTGSPVWAVVAKPSQVEAGMTVKLGYGTLDDAGGTVSADIHVVTGSAAEGKKMAAMATQQVDQMKKAGQLPPELAGVLKSLRITSAGAEARFQLSLPEKQLLGLIGTVAGQI